MNEWLEDPFQALMAEELLKEKIEKSFSKAASHYEKEAKVQKECAARLMQYLNCFFEETMTDPLPEGGGLEIGCGTGFVTKELIKKFGHYPLLVTDLSHKMLQTCENNLSKLLHHKNSVTFQILDGESQLPQQTFSFIASGFTFQWFRNIRGSLTNLLRSLKPGGVLFFSFLERNSFPEWKAVCTRLNVPYTANPLPALEEVEELMQELSVNFRLWKDYYPMSYPNALEFFKSFKRLGSKTSITKQTMNPDHLRHICRFWDLHQPNGIWVTHHVAFGCIQKKGLSNSSEHLGYEKMQNSQLQTLYCQ